MKVTCVWEKGVLRPLIRPKLAEGETVTVEINRPRSIRQHNLLFLAIKRAFDNWPEDHPFQPDTDEQLRYWLEIKAGWGETVEFSDPIHLVHFLNRHWRDNMWAEEKDGKFFVHIAKSIAYGKMEKGDFRKLCDRIDTVLLCEMGVGLSDLKQNVFEVN